MAVEVTLEIQPSRRLFKPAICASQPMAERAWVCRHGQATLCEVSDLQESHSQATFC